MISTRIKRQLETLDWDFSEHIPGTSKSIHWYPGTFPSELPATLIQALSGQNDLVLDPYGGVGTTALEALRQGRRAWLVEGNPVGCLVSYVSGCMLLLKVVHNSYPSIMTDILRSTVSGCAKTSQGFSRLATDDHVPKEVDAKLKNLVKPTPARFSSQFNRPPNWDSLAKWIEASTIEDIKSILRAIEDSELKHFGKLFGLTMISAILRPASSQTKSWGHIADNVWPKEFERKDVFRLCMQWLGRSEAIINKTDVSKWTSDNQSECRFWVSFHSWQRSKRPPVSPNILVDVLLTSPPYAGAIDYTLAQRLSLYLFGYSEDEVRQFCTIEIGARRKRFMAASKMQWADDLVDALSQQVSYLTPEASLAFVLPHKDAGREIGPLNIEKYLHGIHCTKIMEIERSIRQGRTRQSWTSIKKEIIQIYNF